MTEQPKDIVRDWWITRSDGSSTSVRARLESTGGALLFFDENDAVLFGYGPGEWLTVERN